MSKFILGSGLVGLIAKDILGNDWEIIPQGRSRYFSFDPALADNYIVVSDAAKEIINIGREIKTIKRAFSIGGSLIFEPHEWAIDMYCHKVYDEPNFIFKKLFKKNIEIFSLRNNDLYKMLLNKHSQDIKMSNAKYGQILEIKDGHILTTTGKFPYSKALSTIPLDSLCKFLKIDMDLKAKDVWIYKIETDQLDFEGATEVFVLDNVFDFYKSTRLSKFEYQFFCLSEIKTPLEYFGAFTNNKLNFSSVDATKISNAIPIASMLPDLSFLKNDHRIECIGSNAQWDDMADIGSCILRILKMRS